ncbi:conserved hypothetical protein [Candidatus Zixiibacteriota bacterium]|nr:conserved hypothetical protein [candidate division Zixibacteria bacterium]
MDVASLRELLAECSTETVVGSTAAFFLEWPKSDIKLSSPHRQLFFLLGLMLTTPEPTAPKDFNEDQWKRAEESLEKIFNSYVWMFWPSPEEAGRLTQNWHSSREVAMPTFLHYFNSGLLASTEQVRSRIERYVVPFDDQIQDIFEISVSDMLLISDAIKRKIQADFTQLKLLGDEEKRQRLVFLEKAKNLRWNTERMRAEAVKSPYEEAARAFFGALVETFKIQKDQLLTLCDPAKAAIFWKIFSARRGAVGELTYPTELNPALNLPLYLLTDDMAMIPLVHSIFLAILDMTERALLNSDSRDRFLRRRDEELEAEVARIFLRFCGQHISVFRSVYETDTLQNEHDLVILWQRRVFVVETKASPPREPLRDPSRAYTRIRDDFRSDRSIQKAYEQAHRIDMAYGKGETIAFFNDKRVKILEISPNNIDRIYCICITRDNFGMLATDLSLLLKKEDLAPYPWAANVLDLESLFDAFSYFGWGLDRFCEYLEAREMMHGKVEAADELEFAGYLISHGSFKGMFEQKYDHLWLNPSYSEVFDRIFAARHGGEPVEYKPHPPVTTDFSSEVRRWRSKSVQVPQHRIAKAIYRKQGRNELCACGSGKKYKRCCGAN